MKSKTKPAARERVHLSLSEETMNHIKKLADQGIGGNNPTAVVTYLMHRGLEGINNGKMPSQRKAPAKR